MGRQKYANVFKLTLHESVIKSFYDKASRWPETRLIFVNSMSDQFHKNVPLDFTQRMFEAMGKLPDQRFKILTKRSKQLLKLSPDLPWHDNIMVGVSIENSRYLHRLDDLKKVPARWKSLSLEPLLGPLPHLDLNGIDWVVCGGESGSGAREMDPDWVRDIRDQCLVANVPFCFKQWGGKKRYDNGAELDGYIWAEKPEKFFGSVRKKRGGVMNKLISSLSPIVGKKYSGKIVLSFQDGKVVRIKRR
jgi:protein gp37